MFFCIFCFELLKECNYLDSSGNYIAECSCEYNFKIAYNSTIDHQSFFMKDDDGDLFRFFKDNVDADIYGIQIVNSFKSNFCNIICFYKNSKDIFHSITIPSYIHFSNGYQAQNKILTYMSLI